jgi:tetratricopeptide (TPR) repeat protein
MKTKNYLLVLSLSIPAFMPSVTLAIDMNASFDRKPITTLLAQFGEEGYVESAKRHQREFWDREIFRQQSEQSVRAEQRKDKERERVRLLAIKLESQRDYIGLGNLLATRGDDFTPEVVNAYQAAIAANPRSTIGYISLGNFWLTRGKLEESISSFNAAISIDPNSSTAHFGRALAIDTKGDIAGAIAGYSQTINIRPDATPYYNRALLKKYKLNDKIGAIQDFRQAARLYRLVGRTDEVGSSIRHLQDLGATE